MAETNGPDLVGIGLFATGSLSFITYHAYKFDGCRCLVPSLKDWYRSLLTWMLFLCNICLAIWAFAWAYCKYELGWVKLGPYGARPWPSALFPEKFKGYNVPLSILLGIVYTFQASLTAQETFYWAHLMRSVRRPKAAKPFLKSRYFYAWIAVSIVMLVVQFTAPWINYKGDGGVQLALELLCGGIIESIVLVASCVVIFKFPKFLDDVRKSGAGPEVQIRLYYYHELNQMRCIFRFLFTIPLFIFGADSMTKAATINNNPMASDFLAALLGGSLCIVLIISVILYLPRSAPSSTQHHAMVGEMPAHFPLMSMLQDGGYGRWDEEERGAMAPRPMTVVVDDSPFAHHAEDGKNWDVAGEDERKACPPAQGSVPMLLETFTSPIAVSSKAQPPRPLQVHVEVESDVHRD